ncbi:MAG TPA: hypothetical protein PLX30_11040 [Methanothrix sp.]|nr:hypothetical protein [Methanothrix sp.]
MKTVADIIELDELEIRADTDVGELKKNVASIRFPTSTLKVSRKSLGPHELKKTVACIRSPTVVLRANRVSWRFWSTPASVSWEGAR